MAKFGSEEWAGALADEINGSSEYRNAGAAWGRDFNGNMLFRFDADEQLAESISLLVRLSGGECQGAEFVADAAHSEAGFTLRAPFTLWQEILTRKTMAATAILTGKMSVAGEKMTLLKHAGANRALIHCTSSVETDWE